jgi:type IV secretion system protein VirB8
MNRQSREDLDAYYKEAGSWATDRQEALRASTRTAWRIAAAAVLVAMAEALALAMLAPLKTVEPYTLLVDKQTGFVQALKPLDAQLVSGNTALTQSFLVQYVLARESFDITTVRGEYRKVALWSEGTARSAYLAGMQATNPDSPLVALPRKTVIETRVKSVSPLGANTALVRFDSVRHDPNGSIQVAQPFVAVITYRYSGEPMSQADRFTNPLGFKVSRYQRNPEALPVVPPATPLSQVPSMRPSAGGPPAISPAPTANGSSPVRTQP